MIIGNGDSRMKPDLCQALRPLRVNVQRLARVALIREKVEANPVKAKDDWHWEPFQNGFFDCRPSNRPPRFPLLPRAAEGDEGLQEVGEAFFPRAFAGDAGGELGFGLRSDVEQPGKQCDLLRQGRGPGGFFLRGGRCGACCGRLGFWANFRVDRRKHGLRILEGRAQPADVAGGFFAGAFGVEGDEAGEDFLAGVGAMSVQP